MLLDTPVPLLLWLVQIRAIVSVSCHRRWWLVRVLTCKYEKWELMKRSDSEHAALGERSLNWSRQTICLIVVGKAQVLLITLNDCPLLLKSWQWDSICNAWTLKTITLIHKNQLTWTMAGSWGRLLVALGGSQTVRSFISLPRKMMYSNTSSRGGIGLSVGRSSVPKERTVEKTTTQFVFLLRL